MVVDELKRLVAFPTVSNRPVTALAAHLADRAEAAGFRVERFNPEGQPDKCTVVASAGPEDPTGGLVISGHMDVVPTEGQPWQSDPFSVVEQDGRLVGRGTADMKGFIAAVVTALTRVNPRDFVRKLVLVWTHDEEIGCLGSAALAAAWSDRTFPQDCWIGEPTEFQVLRMHPGHVAVEFAIGGKAAHSSRPDLGLNAIVGAAAVVLAAQQFAEALEERKSQLAEMTRPFVTLNVGEIRGGKAINIVPDGCTVRIGFRPLPGQDPMAIHAELLERIEALKLPNPVAAKVLRITPALLTDDGTPLRQALAAHADHEACGAATFATDGGNLARMGMKPLVFGPGAITVAHQANEFLHTKDLLRAVDIAEAMIRRWCLPNG